MAVSTKIHAYAELMRLANVFTAISNVWMGMIVSRGGLSGWTAVGITVTSALLYVAGMVLNDVFDHESDASERSDRPIPSGRVSLPAARTLGWGLLLAGIACGWATSLVTQTFAPGVIATLLALAIVAYDAGLKGTRFGPLAMASCRTLNVLLGFSLPVSVASGVSGSSPWNSMGVAVALGVGLYVFGVTWFARTEARQSSRSVLAMSAIAAMAGLALIAMMPAIDAASPPLVIQRTGWAILWFVVAGSILRRMVVAVMQPAPKYVQRAVGHAILSIIVVDAAICLGFASPFWALAVLALLAPAALLAQFLKVT